MYLDLQRSMTACLAHVITMAGVLTRKSHTDANALRDSWERDARQILMSALSTLAHKALPALIRFVVF